MNYLNIMSTKKLLFLLGVVFLLISCGKGRYVNPPIENYLVYDNQSSHTIVIKLAEDAPHIDKQYLPEIITLTPNEKVEIRVISQYSCKSLTTAIFDGSVVIDYSSAPTDTRKITTLGGYEKKMVKSWIEQYLYTFTDADYQYALENGQKLEY